ncbi:DUF6207 family protein [Streptomyces mirabilis]
MNLINKEPGLVVVNVAAADAVTALAVQAALAAQWATATADRVTQASPVYGCAATWTCASRSAQTQSAVRDQSGSSSPTGEPEADGVSAAWI